MTVNLITQQNDVMDSIGEKIRRMHSRGTRCSQLNVRQIREIVKHVNDTIESSTFTEFEIDFDSISKAESVGIIERSVEVKRQILLAHSLIKEQERSGLRNKQSGDGILELHHLIPEKIPGSNRSRDNIGAITGREHYQLHLLWAMFDHDKYGCDFKTFGKIRCTPYERSLDINRAYVNTFWNATIRKGQKQDRTKFERSSMTRKNKVCAIKAGTLANPTLPSIEDVLDVNTINYKPLF